jgi:PGM1 C-terminal domain
VLPHPPYASQLSQQEELEAFARLKPRLADVWQQLGGEADLPSTTVVVPSMTLDQAELQKLEGASLYEERLLFLLIRLRNPQAHLVYLTSQPVHPQILDYLLQHLLGVPASHAKARLTMLCVHDASARPLTEKILERPRLIQRIRAAIRTPERAYLSVFNATPLERRLAVLLDLPLNGVDPSLAGLGTKSGSRKIFREAGVACPAGFEDLRDEDDVIRALDDLRRQRPGIRRAVVKLNDSFSGEGNAIFRYPTNGSPTSLEHAFRGLEFIAGSEGQQSYFEKFRRDGGIVEEFLEGTQVRSPSVQLRTSPRGEVVPLSTHDQILGGPSSQVFLGCRFPADVEYRREAQAAGLRVGRVLADHGVVSRFGVDFMAYRASVADPWRLNAIEINLRLGGTTHPFLALRFLCGGALDESTGRFLSASGREKHYRATDNLQSPRYRGLLPEDLIDIVTINQLNFSYRTETGVVFHMIGALSQFGKVGVTAIGDSDAEADAIYQKTLTVLERETEFG